MKFDIAKAIDAGFDAVKQYVDRGFSVVEGRLAALEARQPERGEKGDTGPAGKDGLPGADGKDGAHGAAGKDGVGMVDALLGKDGNLVLTMSNGEAKSLGVIVGKDGRDGAAGKDSDPELVKQLVDEAIAVAVPDAVHAEVKAAVSDEVAKAVAEIPAPKDGVDGRDGESGPQGEKGEPGATGAAGIDGKDGLDVVDFFRDAKGHLVASMSNGTTRDLGDITGPAGRDGQDGAPGRDGADGKDGQDGIGFDDLAAKMLDDGRTIQLSFVRGAKVKTFDLSVPVMIYRGVFREGQTYEKGDTVTWGGSLWHCDASQTAVKPDGAQKHWTLAAKRGQNGKDAEARA